MRRSKLDRLGNAVKAALHEAISSVELEMYQKDDALAARALREMRDKIVLRTETNLIGWKYRRLEIADIIEGRKRAWPDPEAKP